MEPLRRKLNNINSNTRRIGDELRRIGQQFTELPKIVEEEGAQSALQLTQNNPSSAHSIILPAKANGGLLSRAAAASSMGQQKSLNNSQAITHRNYHHAGQLA